MTKDLFLPLAFNFKFNNYMKKNQSQWAFLSLSIFAAFVFMSACLKQNSYSAPYHGISTDSIMTIKALRKLHILGAVENIRKDYSIEGLVVANDESDNLYKTISIQDSTGGIMLLLDATNIYQTYPIGTLIRLRIQDLFLSDYRRMLQIVASVDTSSGSLLTAGIPAPLFSKYITVIKENVAVLPINVSYKSLSDTLQGRLIKISNVEFASADTGQTFSDKKNKIGASRAVKFCVGGTIYLRTSGYANFAGVKLPSGNGDIMGIYSVFNSEKQIFIRDTSDILLKGRRCTGAAWLQNLPH